MKTAIASDPGDDSENELRRGSYSKATAVYWRPRDIEIDITPVLNPGCSLASGDRASAVLMLSELAQTYRNLGGAVSDFGVDETFPSDDGPRVLYQVKQLISSGWVTEASPSADPDPQAPRHGWTARFGPVTVTMRFLYQRGWFRLPALPPGRLAGTAMFLLGRKHDDIRAEWRSHVYDWQGRGRSRAEQVRDARGFVKSAVQMRIEDASDLAWRPVDSVLRSRTKSNLFVLIPTVLAAIFIFSHEGTLGVLESAEAIDAIGLMLYGLIRVGRWYRRVKPPKPRTWNAKR
jgi:hypothetical protein